MTAMHPCCAVILICDFLYVVRNLAIYLFLLLIYQLPLSCSIPFPSCRVYKKNAQSEDCAF